MAVNNAYVRVRYGETDKMGISYHANYIPWFEVGRVEYIRELGMSYAQMEELGVLLPVTSVNCEYVKPALYDDMLRIETRLTKFKGARVRFSYVIYRSDSDELLASGETCHAIASPDLKPLRLERTHPKIYEMLRNVLEEDYDGV